MYSRSPREEAWPCTHPAGLISVKPRLRFGKGPMVASGPSLDKCAGPLLVALSSSWLRSMCAAGADDAEDEMVGPKLTEEPLALLPLLVPGSRREEACERPMRTRISTQGADCRKGARREQQTQNNKNRKRAVDAATPGPVPSVGLGVEGGKGHRWRRRWHQVGALSRGREPRCRRRHGERFSRRGRGRSHRTQRVSQGVGLQGSTEKSGRQT